MPFYLQYLTTWPEYFLIKESPDGTPMGYSELIPGVPAWRVHDIPRGVA